MDFGEGVDPSLLSTNIYGLNAAGKTETHLIVMQTTGKLK